MQTSNMVRPPITLRLQIVDADGVLIEEMDGPTVELGNLDALTSYGRAVGLVAVMHDLLRRVFLIFTVQPTRKKVDDLVGEIALYLSKIEGEPDGIERN
jgi:hypothetical protein